MQTSKEYLIHLKSLSPLVTHKDTLVDPLHPLKKQMNNFTSLKVKQDEHHLAIAKIEWEAGLFYDDEIGLYLSSRMLGGCFKASARKEKKGKDTKAIIIDCFPGAPLIGYEKMTIEKLWNTKNKKGEQVFVLREAVNVNRAKVMRTRPIFPQWEVKFKITLNTEILSEIEMRRIIERAGMDFGIGELRPELATGICGRFTLEEMKKI